MRTRLASAATAILLATTALFVAGPTIMAAPAPFTVVSQSFNLKRGTDTSQAVDITAQYAAGYTTYTVFFPTDNWPNDGTNDIACAIQFSPDNGVTWGWGAGSTTSGGPHTTSKGNPWGCGASSALPGSANWPTPDGWPTNPASVLVRMQATVPSTQSTTLHVSLI